MIKVLFWLGAAVPFYFLPIPDPWSYLVMIIGVLLISFLPTIGSAIALAAWIWAAIVVFSMPFSWLTVVFALFGLFCVIEFGYSFFVGIGELFSHKARNESVAKSILFSGIGLGDRMGNMKELPTPQRGTFFGPSEGMYFRDFSDGEYRVHCVWSDMMRAPVMQGKKPSFTEWFVVYVTGPDNQTKSYCCDNLNIPSAARIELQEDL